MKHKPANRLGSNLLSRHNYRDYSLRKNGDDVEVLAGLQNVAKEQSMALKSWPKVEKVEAWMISSETATFMKVGGLGVVATELPEAFNRVFAAKGEKISVVTPLYIGDTSHKKASLKKGIYTGAENRSVKISKIGEINVPFVGKKRVVQKFKVKVYTAVDGLCRYVFLANRRFFTITTDYRNPDCQDGCYVFNKLGVDEVERFAFFSKSVFVLLMDILKEKINLEVPNVLIANDWHSGALAGLTKYLTPYLAQKQKLDASLAEKINQIPLIHLAHHMGYQGWDSKNTTKLLNALYEDAAKPILVNADTYKCTNPRIENTLLVDGAYNQACCNLHLADRLVVVSRNYAQEVSKEKNFGYDFCDLLKKRQDNHNFFGIVNGYDKKLIAPKAQKIERINHYFGGIDFKYYDENAVEFKKHNKREFIKLISKLASDAEFKHKTVPLVNFYQFEDISELLAKSDRIPMYCATSRLVEQKGYDIAADAIVAFLEKKAYKEAPIWVLGGAGDMRYFEFLTKLKDRVAAKNPQAAKRIFVFKGYKDEFAYAIQLASDFYMMPCRFEPCGLTQMEAMAKGTLPVVMSTGGLVDTIEDGIDGFRTLVFYGDSGDNQQVYGTPKDAKLLKNNVVAFADVLKKSLDVFENNPAKLKEMTIQAMQKDFSWDVENGSVYKYYKLFKTGKIA